MIGQYSDLAGPTAVVTATQRALLRNQALGAVLEAGDLVSTAVDAGNTPTTQLRTGLVLGRITATSRLKAYDGTATDGSQDPVGILFEDRNMLDWTGTARDQQCTYVIAGYVVASNVIGLDPRVRQILGEFIIFDDKTFPEPYAWKPPVAKTADYTCVEADSGRTFTNQGAGGAVVFTLPAIGIQGWRARFYIEAGQTVTITAPAGKLVAFNNAAATSIAFSTSAEKIGTMVEIYANADATKYLSVVSLAAETVTPTIS